MGGNAGNGDGGRSRRHHLPFRHGRAGRLRRSGDVYDRESERKGVTELHIAKHRNGPTGIVSLLFQERSTRFVDLGQDPERRN